jgi:hypothetical protein
MMIGDGSPVLTDVHFTMDVFSALEFSALFRSRVSNLLLQEAFDLL